MKRNLTNNFLNLSHFLGILPMLVLLTFLLNNANIIQFREVQTTTFTRRIDMEKVLDLLYVAAARLQNFGHQLESPTLIVGLLVGICLMLPICNYYRKGWRRDVDSFQEWANNASKKLDAHEKQYQLQEVTTEGEKQTFATFDGGKRWYRVEIQEDGLHIYTELTEEAHAVLPQAILHKSKIEDACQRYGALF
jgi:hypothetical protein